MLRPSPNHGTQRLPNDDDDDDDDDDDEICGLVSAVNYRRSLKTICFTYLGLNCKFYTQKRKSSKPFFWVCFLYLNITKKTNIFLKGSLNLFLTHTHNVFGFAATNIWFSGNSSLNA